MRMRLGIGVVILALVSSVACGPSSKRDPDVPARSVTYDDACGLQSYFDERREANLPAPTAADESIASDEKGVTAGIGTYVLRDPMIRRRFAKLLREEYKGIEPQIVAAVESSEGDVKVRLKWWDAGATRRLRVGHDILLYTSAGNTELPPNPCVADLLFGAKIYEMRHRYVSGELDRAREGTSSEAPAATTSAPPVSTTSAPPAPPASSAPPPAPPTPSAAPSASAR